MLLGTPDSPDREYYGSLDMAFRHLIGFGKPPLDKYKLVPSVLEHYETSLRDPAFYQLAKYMLTFWRRYKDRLPPHTKIDLEFPGIKIESMQVE